MDKYESLLSAFTESQESHDALKLKLDSLLGFREESDHLRLRLALLQEKHESLEGEMEEMQAQRGQ